MQYDHARPMRRFRAVNENASGFASKIPTTTKPSGTGSAATTAAVLDLTEYKNIVPKRIKFIPFLLGSDDDASSMRIIGWHSVLLDGKTTLWVPTIIGEYALVAGTAVGVADAAVLATERFCDTITPVAARQRDQIIAAGTAIGSDYEVLSPVGNLIGHIIIPIGGFQLLEITSDQTTGTATFNTLYAFLEN